MNFGNFYLVLSLVGTANSNFFPNFDHKNHYEILVIQTYPLACTQRGIQILSRKNFRQLIPF